MKQIKGIFLSMIIGIVIFGCSSKSNIRVDSNEKGLTNIKTEEIVIEEGWYEYPFNIPGIKMEPFFVRKRSVRRVPIYYPDAGFMVAAFPVPVKQIKKLIPDDNLVPLEIEPGLSYIMGELLVISWQTTIYSITLRFISS